MCVATHQASVSVTVSLSLHKPVSIESVMLSNHIVLCQPLFIQPSVFPASGSFPVSWLFAWGDQCIEASASASVLPMNIQGWFPLGLTGLISLLSKGLSRVFSNTTVWKHQFFDSSPWVPTLTSIHDYWKNYNFDYTDFCWQWWLCFLICCLGWS